MLKNIKFEYYSYSEELLKDIDTGKIHIFTNKDKRKGGEVALREKEEKDRIFEKQGLILSDRELKSRLFLSDEIVLKEEKQVIAFYKSLTPKVKNKLRITSYYDVIDIAANFFNFYKLLKENSLTIEKVVEKGGLKVWQRNIIDTFEEAKELYTKYLKERNYTDQIFIISEENFTLDPLKGYKEVVFYNKLWFSNMERWILKKLLENGFEITVKLQLNKKDFNEEELRLTDVSLGEKEKLDIKVYETQEEFIQLGKVINLGENSKSLKILDCNNENNKYNNFFKTNKYISDLKIYSLLEKLHMLLSTIELIGTEVALELYTVVEVIKSPVIKAYYGISELEIQSLKKMIDDGYKYLTKDIIGNELNPSLEVEHFLLKLFKDIQKLLNYESLKEWLEYLEFNPEILKEFIGSEDGIAKYFEALSEVDTIEKLDIVGGSWNNFFIGNKSQGLLKLIMKYLEFKEVEVDSGRKLNKMGLSEMGTESSKELLIINCSDSYLPKPIKNSFLLTENQKKILGIKGSEEERREAKYDFFRGVQTAKKVTLIGLKNLEMDLSLSPFVEELVNFYNLEVVEIKQGMDNYIDLITPKGDSFEREGLGEVGSLKFQLEELKNPMWLTPYMVGDLLNCHYKMKMRYIERLSYQPLEVEKNLTVREYGILAHELFEVVLKRVKKEKNFQLFNGKEMEKEEKSMIYKDLEILVGKRRLKLPKVNEGYYNEIIYPNLVSSVIKFFKEISKVLRGEEVREFYIEEMLSRFLLNFENKIDIKGRGKADLIIKTDTREFIIDFKTGKLNEVQLDFYSILHKGKSTGTKKYIFNVDKGSLEESSKIKLVANTKDGIEADQEGKNKGLEILDEKIKELLKGKEFLRVPKGCNRCEYIDICNFKDVDIDG